MLEIDSSQGAIIMIKIDNNEGAVLLYSRLIGIKDKY